MQTRLLVLLLFLVCNFCAAWRPPKRLKLNYKPERYNRNLFGNNKAVYGHLMRQFDKNERESESAENRRLLMKYSKKWNKRVEKTRFQPQIRAEKRQKNFYNNPSGDRWHPGMFSVNKRSNANTHYHHDPYDEDAIAHAIDDLMLKMKEKGIHQAQMEKMRHLNLKSDHGYLDGNHLATQSLLNFLFERTGNAQP